MTSMAKVTEVAAAVIFRTGDNGTEYLLAQRPPGKVYADYWEFPGGKVEPGETFHDALVRELHEELGICVDRASPWITREFVYPHAHVRLKFFHVHSWHGTITPIEHSGIIWTELGCEPAVSPVLPANGPILRALELPPSCILTNASENGVDAELNRLETAMHDGFRLIQVRDKQLPPDERRRLGKGVMTLARRFDKSIVLVNDDLALASELGAHGVHLSSRQLMQTTTRPAFDRVAASCEHFSLPVFALGGMKPELLDCARRHGAHGIALLRGW